MASIKLIRLFAFVTLLSCTNAADCLLSQPRRDGDPAGQDIANALTAESQIQNVCAGNWPLQNDLESTWNHQFMIYKVSRSDNGIDITKDCVGGMNNIISQCIAGDSYWGGTWSLNGATFTISNSVFPENPLKPGEAGGPPATGTTSPPTKEIPGQQVVEVTTDGQTITVTFAPTTLAQYETVTSQTTATTTGDDGNPTPVVIWPGGIIWGIVGAPPVVPILPPIVPPPGVPAVPGGGRGGDNPRITSKPDKPNPTTTTSSSTSTTTSNSCYLYNDPGPDAFGPADSDDEDSGETKRSIAGRVAYYAMPKSPGLEKRGKNEYSVIGKCQLPVLVKQPGYPRAPVIVKQETGDMTRNSLLFSTAKWWFVLDKTNCLAPTYTKMDTATVKANGIAIGSNAVKSVNIEHVWELKFLNFFLESRLSSLDCSAFNALLSVPIDTQNTKTRLQTLFEFLPGDDYPEIAGISSTINRAKGLILMPGGSTSMSAASDTLKLDLLQTVRVTLNLCHNDEIKTLFDITNNRMYSAFLGIDKAISDGCLTKPDGQKYSEDWASSYKQWITNYLSSRSSEVSTWVSKTAAELATSTDPDVLSGLQSFASRSVPVDFDFGLTWAGNPIQMRSLHERGPSCTKEPDPNHTQEAVPIDSPGCQSNAVSSMPNGWNLPKTGSVKANDLLFRMRGVICSNRCEVPEDILSDTVVVTQNAEKTDCEIAIGISSAVEVFMYRGTPSVDVQWQQCWDSTENIINKCVQNGPNLGWWNGDHVYQFYKAGIRPLNDPDAAHKIPLKSWLPLAVPAGTTQPSPLTPTTGYTCMKDCRSIITDSTWCNEHCPCSRLGHVC